MTWPARDFVRWHITPDRDQYKPVTVHNTKTHKLMTIYTPRICPDHFCTIAECMWSFYIGQGYPLEDTKRQGRRYWEHMARLNRRWKLRTARERNKASEATD